ncbi:hypothetical protein PGT21_008065 [Puccinia graminis f. sp. tritici]|uniref:Uncharacterized protein n=1 Tax=Puccinia graminis f. sp. tritici TaxID=56615 RepID=A0A5B0NIH9_PUCGR|nr:hypothetical protein PGT21_008065 [Puccinia graminis f. sp. tritici]
MTHPPVSDSTSTRSGTPIAHPNGEAIGNLGPAQLVETLTRVRKASVRDQPPTAAPSLHPPFTAATED